MQFQEAKDTFFSKKRSLLCRGKILTFDRARVMGVLNITPDSFYDGGKYMAKDFCLQQCDKMVAEGADIIDIGGMSTRPGASEVTPHKEESRIIPVIKSIRKRFPDLILSVDTYKASVAEKAIAAGADIINDISCGTFDHTMLETAARLQVPYIGMHTRGKPDTMQNNISYQDVCQDILQFFSKQINTMIKTGIKDIVIDPGFGFGKETDQNYELLARLKEFAFLEQPILVGVSRKSMINRVLNIKPSEALNGSTVLHTIALLNGADILRVHDVKEAKQAVSLVGKYIEMKTDK